MSWELKKVEEQRKALIDAYIRGEASMTDLCTQYCISRKTAYKWLNRFTNHGLDGLKDQSTAPVEPNRVYGDHIINMALDLKLKRPKWGPKKIVAILCQQYPKIEWPSSTRLYEIFKDHHLVKSRRLRTRLPGTHPLGDINASNEVWMADFKGWFLTGNQTKCEPLTITDGYSRYLIECRHMNKKTSKDIWPVFAEAFHEYGLPNRIRTDNGSPFGCVGAGRLTELTINFIKAGVLPEWINPGHPEENGRHERFHLTLQIETASPPADTLEEQIISMRKFAEAYNYDRPHESLKMNTPASCYNKSKRTWDGVLRKPEYDSKTEVRKVGQNGCIWIKQKPYYIGEVLEGEDLGLQEFENGYNIQYGQIFLGKLKIGGTLERPKLLVK